MKKWVMMWCLALVVAVPASSYALLGFEAAAGVWYAMPSGDMKYKSSTSDDLKDAFGFDNKSAAMGRVKVDLPVIPIIYLMATPLEFTGDSKQSITIDGTTYNADANTKLTYNQYDLALYYGVPFLGLATLGTIHVNGGINVRMIDAKAEVNGMAGATADTTTVEKTIPLPMLYLSADICPTDSLALEAELRALSVGYGSIVSAIARLRYSPIGPLFVAAGYRYEDMSIDKDDFKADIKLGGPFAEVGLKF
jgi:outer membrane protein